MGQFAIFFKEILKNRYTIFTKITSTKLKIQILGCQPHNTKPKPNLSIPLRPQCILQTTQHGTYSQEYNFMRATQYTV